MITKQKLKVLFVTYGDRRKTLEGSIISVVNGFQDSIKELIIVQNGISYDIHKFIDGLPINNSNCSFIINSENTGSAGGFGAGIDFAIKNNYNYDDYLLVLDDDCCISKSVAREVINADEKKFKNNYGKFAISLYRPKHDQDSSKFLRNWDYDEKYYKNTINRFSLFHRINSGRFQEPRQNKNVAELFMVPYSGLIVKTGYLREINPVRKDYYLYDDDLRFTSQLSLSGVKIICMKDLFLDDLEKSWYQDDKKIQSKSTVQLFLQSHDRNSLERAYYQIRNGVYTGKSIFYENFFIYYFNLFIFCIFPFFKYTPKKIDGLRRYGQFLKAVFQGVSGQLGKITSLEEDNYR